jgi:multidrug efflux pump subunit AcrA (membrane-fusion protein)
MVRITKISKFEGKLLNLIWIAVLIAATFVSGCSSISSLTGQTTPTPVPVDTEDIQTLVTATGVVVPVQWSQLSFSTPGTVEEVLFNKGDQVTPGQTLARLRGREELQANIAAAHFEIISAQTAIDNLYDSAERTQIDALKAISIAADMVRDAQYQLDNYIVPQEQAGLETIEAFDLMRDRLDVARQAFEPYKYFSSGNDRRQELKEDLDEAQADYNVAVKRLEYEYELQVAQAKLEEARKDYDILKQGPKPEELAVAQARLENAQASLSAAEAALEDLELNATFNGTISELDVRVGEWVTPGQPVLVLANLQDLRIETTDLNEIDAARVEPGDAVIVTFDALPDVQVKGTVESIAPKASPGTGVNYTAVVVIDEWPESLRWGMTAFVDIEVKG